MNVQIFSGAMVFDGGQMLADHSVVVKNGSITAILADSDVPNGETVVLQGGVLAPGLIDLQVNGGGGVMLDGSADVACIAHICATHGGLGATGILPTLITDTPQATAAAISAGIAAAQAGVPGFLGLHLEGPHLDPRRKGAHDPALIRPMDEGDLKALCVAAAALPALMVTLAPASVTTAQIATLAAAGAVVSLGHADCTLSEADAAMDAGARCVTHLFNAMSQLGSREPGLVGAALRSRPYAGLIADGLHVHPHTIGLALAAKGLGKVFLVSDAMAVAGTDVTDFTLGGRRILRQQGRLTLEDGTLAGADLTLPEAVRTMIRIIGLRPEQALAMATSVPAGLLGLADEIGLIAPGVVANLVHFDTDWQLAGVWRAGKPLVQAKPAGPGS
ncbi:N-acetylglucosamine-6-phosphate deacetylase [Phaeovulum sp.]|uniref:N-acetylglucosamine-6-phosphate deacetylase n=1 Tax=Phaeovulum sp. TaxID=2934796 RepID=UPI0039E65B6A